MGYLVIPLLEAGYYVIAGADAMAIVLGGKWGD